jgi:hypothetical protein
MIPQAWSIFLADRRLDVSLRQRQTLEPQDHNQPRIIDEDEKR